MCFTACFAPWSKLWRIYRAEAPSPLIISRKLISSKCHFGTLSHIDTSLEDLQLILRLRLYTSCIFSSLPTPTRIANRGHPRDRSPISVPNFPGEHTTPLLAGFANH